MSIAEHALEASSEQTVRPTELSFIAVPYRRFVYLACVVLALACNYVLGQDLAWDTQNYHLYLGFSALNDRFDQDYFAAGTLSYLNPYAYIPFYAMVQAGLPALAICSIFAALHSIILWLCFELGVAVCPAKDDRSRVFAGICAITLAFMNPILMQQIGSCFADITTAELALGGWLLLAGAVRRSRLSSVIFAGLILGAASALKLSNALSAISAFAMLAMLPLGWRSKIRHGVLYGVSLGIGFVVIAAPWSYRLAMVFHNPLFPMFNQIFRSPDFPVDSGGTAYRFIPGSLGEALWRPFAMIDPRVMVHEEMSAPDPRYAILVVLIVLFVAHWGLRRLRGTSDAPNHSQSKNSTRVLAALGLGLFVYWILWLYVSGNSRYVLTMACIAAAVIVGMLFRLFESRPKVRNYILASIFLTQAVQLCMGAQLRWNEGASWSGPWFDFSLPAKLKTEPNLYLTLGTQSNSFLAPFLAKDSAMVNIVGGYTMDPEGPNGVRVKELIRRFSPHVKVVFSRSWPYESVRGRRPVPLVDNELSGFGLRPNMANCDTIILHGQPPALQVRYETSSPEPPLQGDNPYRQGNSYLITCSVVPDIADRSAAVVRQHAVDLVFNRLEDACPRLFQPRRVVTEHDGDDQWRRFYGGTDLVARVSKGRVIFNDLIHPQRIIDVGRERDWATDPLRLSCGRRKGVYFAQVLQSSP